MNSKQIAHWLRAHGYLRKMVYFVIFITTLREWHIRKGIKMTLAKLPETFSLLDVGFGLGQHLYRIARLYPRARLFGIEHDADLVADFHAFLIKQRLDYISVAVANIQDGEPMPRQDIILCCSVLEHIQEDQRTLQHLATLLNSGGYLLIYVPTAEKRAIKWLAEKIKRGAHQPGELLPHGHVRYYQPEELKRKLRQAGLKVVFERVTYGGAGRLAYDIVTAIQYSRLMLFWLPLYLMLVHPLVIILMLIDYLQTHKQGNGYMCIAQKQTA